MFIANLKKVEAEVAAELDREEGRYRRPFVTAFMVVFVAEWGDLSQPATAAFQPAIANR
jgi:putative Ca2+/H+ antiporter (TMEM165/GDT1 family)